MLVALTLVAGCTMQPVAYLNACPQGNYNCQRNQDAQTLHYIGEHDAAVQLMCANYDVAPFMGDSCTALPSLY